MISRLRSRYIGTVHSGGVVVGGTLVGSGAVDGGAVEDAGPGCKYGYVMHAV